MAEQRDQNTETVLLNGTEFVIRGTMLSRHYEAWADPTRVVGSTRRSDKINAPQWVMENWESGAGYFRHIGAPPTPESFEKTHPSFNGFYMSTVETRFPGQVTLPGLQESFTATVNDEMPWYKIVRAWQSASLDGFLVLSSEANDAINGANSTITSIEEKKDLSGATYNNLIIRTAFPHNGNMYLMGGDSTTIGNVQLIMNAAGSFSDLSPSTPPGGVPIAGTSIKDIIYLVVREANPGSNGKRMWIEKSTDDGDNFSAVSGTEFTYRNLDHADWIIGPYSTGLPAAFLHTEEGLKFFVVSTEILSDVAKLDNTWTTRNFYDAGRAHFYGGEIYLPRGKSLIRYNPQSGIWRDVSVLTQKRIPSSYQGRYIGNTVPFGSWLFVAIPSTDTSTIWAYDGINDAWHSIASFDTSAGLISGLDFIIIGTGAADADNDLVVMYKMAGQDTLMFKIDDIGENPLEITKKYASSGTLITPDFDAGMSEIPAAIIQTGGSFDDLDAGNEEIQVETALNLSTSYEAGAGTVLTFDGTETNRAVKFASGAGIEALSWRHKFTFSRGSTNTKTPIMYYPVTTYRKKVVDLHRFQVVVDIGQTVARNPNFQTATQVMSKLETINDNVPLVTFVYPGSSAHTGGATRYVEIEEMPAQTDLEGNPLSRESNPTRGAVVLTLREIV